MRKGVTPIVAIIILLLITIALAGAAYTYLSGYFQTVAGKAIELSFSSCIVSANTEFKNVTITFRNIGTDSLSFCTGNFPTDSTTEPPLGTAVECGDLLIVKTSGTPGLNYSVSSTTVNPGETFTFADQCDTATSCVYRFTTGRSSLSGIVVNC